MWINVNAVWLSFTLHMWSSVPGIPSSQHAMAKTAAAVWHTVCVEDAVTFRHAALRQQ